jgi:hypothetical protein
VPRWKRLSFLFLSHQKSLQIMRNVLCRVKENPHLDLLVVLLVNVLDWNENILLPMGTKLLMGLKLEMFLQTGFQFPIQGIVSLHKPHFKSRILLPPLKLSHSLSTSHHPQTVLHFQLLQRGNCLTFLYLATSLGKDLVSCIGHPGMNKYRK